MSSRKIKKRILALSALTIFSVGSYIQSANKKAIFDNHPDSNHSISETMRTDLFGAPYTLVNPHKPIVITVDKDIPEYFRYDIQKAVERIDEVSENLTFEFKVADSNNPFENSIKIKEFNPTFLKLVEGTMLRDGGTPLGLAHVINNIVSANTFRNGRLYLNPEEMRSKGNTYTITLHEIMHFLGFDDVTRGDTIMRGNISNVSYDLTEQDIFNLNFYYSDEFVKNIDEEQNKEIEGGIERFNPYSHQPVVDKDIANEAHIKKIYSFLTSLEKKYLERENKFKNYLSDQETINNKGKILQKQQEFIESEIKSFSQKNNFNKNNNIR